ncbi:LacI family DNA-binding transcriptional regulator [Microlunatus soli]|uniref:Transcriptional regulator, LacI family n=1 Tax=Microlunatus soli TaxID=630515 RepID=A0A1H1Z096_9ACTN|nr:LacI family DNA-binding transcriptional regulator [Microlunatus soli]SDT26616.1 transcriptional regulator, LacI family [Microlunatus soli]
MTSSRRPTVNEVAERAGVSIASVSRVLNGKGARAETERLVREAAAALGYIPDATGRSLKLGRGLQVAFAVDDVANPVYTEMMRGVEDGLRDAGQQRSGAADGPRLVVASVGHELEDLIALISSLSRGFADGLVISPLRTSPALVTALLEAPVPVVVVGNPGDKVPIDTVRTDSGRGVKLAFGHLADGGRQRIAFVNGPSETAPGRARLHGFESAAEGPQGGLAGAVVEASAFTVEAGEEAWARLAALPARRRPDAVVAANDLLAFGVLRAAVSAGRQVPRDLAVVGIDDTEYARIYNPSLTSVSLGAVRRGTLAAGLLLDRMQQPSRAPRTRRVNPRLVIRESSAPRSVRR